MDRDVGEQRHRVSASGTKESNRIVLKCIRYSHLTALAEAAQQQSRVGGNNAVLHMFTRMLQSYSTHKGEQIRFTVTDTHTQKNV